MATPTLAEAEARAAQLLTGWWVTPDRNAPLPIDPFELARWQGILVRREHLPTNQSGKIEFYAGGEAAISINVLDHPNRQRFTCAHEIGHYLRRQDGVGNSSWVDYRDTLAGLGSDPEEIFANQFGAALLMPPHLMTEFRQIGRTPEHMAQKFGTSVQAVELRLRNLRLA